MKLHSLQIIPGVHYPETAIVDVMLQPDPDVQSFRHVRASLYEFVHIYPDPAEVAKVLSALTEWAEGLKSRVADPA